MISGIIYVIRYGLQRNEGRSFGPWVAQDLPRPLRAPEPPRAVFEHGLAVLVAQPGVPERLLNDKARTRRRIEPLPACSRRGMRTVHRTHERLPEFQAARGLYTTCDGHGRHVAMLLAENG